jgi:hypothetical protein
MLHEDRALFRVLHGVIGMLWMKPVGMYLLTRCSQKKLLGSRNDLEVASKVLQVLHGVRDISQMKAVGATSWACNVRWA